MTQAANFPASDVQPPIEAPLMQVRDLHKHYPIRRGLFQRVVGQVKAVDGVSFDIHPGECLALVGESGSGKTTVGKCILRAIEPTSGQVTFRIHGAEHAVAEARDSELKLLRQHMQMVFQDPFSSLNPRMSVFEIISEPLLVNGMRSRREREQRVRELMSQVGLRPQHMQRYPHAFSGGQRQRIGIARALALNPKLIVADEAVSALDVSVQAQVLNLLQELQQKLSLTYLFIAHDLSVVQHIADRVAVMYLGQIVELAPVDALFENPMHPYTRALLSAVPQPDPRVRMQPILAEGDIPDAANPPAGCRFHPRCPHAESRCSEQAPALREWRTGHFVRCHRAEELQELRLEGAPIPAADFRNEVR